MQIPNANGRVRRFCRRQLLRIVVSREKNTMEQFVLVSPKIDKDKCGIAAVVNTNKSDSVIVYCFFRQLVARAISLADANNDSRGRSSR